MGLDIRNGPCPKGGWPWRRYHDDDRNRPRDLRSEVCILDGEGLVSRRFSVATTRAGLKKRLAGLAPVRSRSRWARFAVGEPMAGGEGYELIVANAQGVRSNAESDAKTDRSDAEQVAGSGAQSEAPAADPPPRRSGAASSDAHRGPRIWSSPAPRPWSRRVVSPRAWENVCPAARPTPSCVACARRGSRIRSGHERDPGPGGASRRPDRRARSRLDAISRTHYPETRLRGKCPVSTAIGAHRTVLTLEDPQRFRKPRRRAYPGCGRAGDVGESQSAAAHGQRATAPCAGCWSMRHALIHRGPTAISSASADDWRHGEDAPHARRPSWPWLANWPSYWIGSGSRAKGTSR